MSLYFYDSIQSVAVGSGLPPGFSGAAFGNVTVEPYSNAGAFSPHKWLSYSGQNLYASLNTAVLSCTAWFAYKFDGTFLNGPIFQTFGYQAPNGNKVTTTQLTIENDNTLSAYVGGSPNSLVFNSGSLNVPFFLQTNVWYFFQIGIQLTTTANALTAKFTIFVDGVEICNAASGISNFYLNSSFISNQISFDTIGWTQPNGSGKVGLSETYVGAFSSSLTYPGNLWTLVIDTPGSGYGPFPPTISIASGDATLIATIGSSGQVTNLLPGPAFYLGDSYTGASNLNLTATPFGGGGGSGFTGHATLAPIPNRKIPQATVERATQPTTANIRISQSLIEHAYQPINAHIRIPQMVIELPLIRSALRSGWIVKEC